MRTAASKLSVRNLREPGDNGRNLVDKLNYARNLKARATRLINVIRSKFKESGRTEFFGTEHVAIFQPKKFRKLDPDKVRNLIEHLTSAEECERLWPGLYSETTTDYLVIRRKDRWLDQKIDSAVNEERL